MICIETCLGYSSELLTLLSSIRSDPAASAREIFSEIKRMHPDTEWSLRLVERERAKVLRPIQVPVWLHEATVIAGPTRVYEYMERTAWNFIKESSKSFSTKLAMTATASVWNTHCVEALQKFPNPVPCYETEIEVDGLRMMGWRLSNEQIDIYLTKLFFAELNRGVVTEDKVLDFDSVFSNNDLMSGATSRDSLSSMEEEASPQKKPRLMVESSTIEPSFEPVSPTRQPGIEKIQAVMHAVSTEGTEFKQLIDTVMSRGDDKDVLFPVVVPMWFHSGLTLFQGKDGEIKADSTTISEELQLIAGKNFDSKYMHLIPFWTQWCLKPLSRWEHRLRSGRPCHPFGDWMILSQPQILLYLEKQIVQY